MTPAPTRFWVFDLDGTLTVAQHDFAAFKRSVGLPPDRPVLEGIALLPEADRPALLAAVHRWELALADTAQPNPGAGALLRALRTRGCPLGILTRNSRETALRTLAAGLDGFFPEGAVLGRDDAAPKPSPEGLLKLLAAWGAPPSAAAMVGDHAFDLDAARAAGMQAIWLDTDHTGELAALADRVVHHLEALVPSSTTD